MQCTTVELPPGTHECDAEDCAQLHYVCSMLLATVTAEKQHEQVEAGQQSV